MLPTILICVDLPQEEEAEPKKDTAEPTLSGEVSRVNIVRESVFHDPSMSTASVSEDDEVEFENGQPTYRGTCIFKCFKNRGNGLLFRIVNNDEFKWAFYNDLNDYIVTVTCKTGANSHVTPLGTTTMRTNVANGDKVLVARVGPCETAMFLDGVPKGFKLNYEAKPIPRAECLARNIKITDASSLSLNMQGASDDESHQRDSTVKDTPT